MTAMIDDLRAALTQRRLSMVYQPQIDAKTGRVGGVEALVRWQRTPGVYVPPDIFIPLAEEGGLVNDLTALVVDLVVDGYRVIQANDITVPMSINISARDLREGDFIPAFLHAAERYLVEPSHFIFEITETAIVDDYAACVRNVGLLKSLGCRISLDDFGTGNASCKYVRHFPMDEVKIDKLYIQEIANNEVDRVIVAFMVDLAHRLGCTTVAEGVENVATAAVLQEVGCDLLQGYHYSRPLDVYALVEYINAKHSK